MKIRLLLASLATAATITFALPTFAADNAQEFVNKAASGGMFEVDSSKIAEGKVQDQSVKEFARKMITDHGAANAKLASIVADQKLTLPKELDAKHKADLDTLQNSKDPVDGPYVQMQRDAHSDAVALFESYASDGDNPKLKAFAQETVPTLKMHQEMIEKIASTMSDSSPATTSTTPAAKPTTEGAPIPGANSFTEDQAKSRIQDAGFAEVSNLKLDDQGIWRGQASKGGKSVSVALDYQGNVVAGNN
jgi:putative membrane protein